MMVPGPKVGLIIGKGGETIKQLQERSGAKLVVIQEGPESESEKPLRITGGPQSLEVRSLLAILRTFECQVRCISDHSDLLGY
jgi:predicted PilT family ATPase